MTITQGDVRANITTLHREKRVSTLQISLQPDAIISLRPTVGETKIQSGSGTLWVTQQGDPMDYFLSAGETFRPHHSGLLVIQAIGKSSVSITG